MLAAVWDIEQHAVDAGHGAAWRRVDALKAGAYHLATFGELLPMPSLPALVWTMAGPDAARLGGVILVLLLDDDALWTVETGAQLRTPWLRAESGGADEAVKYTGWLEDTGWVLHSEPAQVLVRGGLGARSYAASELVSTAYLAGAPSVPGWEHVRPAGRRRATVATAAPVVYT